MKSLEVSFGLEGFRLLRAKPWLVLVWGLIITGLLAGVGFAAYHFGLPFFTELQKSTPDAKVMGNFLAIFIPGYILFILALIVVMSMFRCAVFRAVLEGRNAGFAYLRLGGDELRQIAANLLMGLLFMVVIGAIVLAGVLIFGAMGSGGNKVGAIWILVLGGIACLWGLSWIGVRLSLYSVQTFATHRINLFGSWNLTSGYVWTLLAGFAIAAILAGIISEAGNAIGQIVLAATMGTNAMMPFSPGNEPKDLHAAMSVMTSPAYLSIIGLQFFLVVPINMILQLAPEAAAYRSLSGQLTKNPEAVF